jgi:hypothetical protein
LYAQASANIIIQLVELSNAKMASLALIGSVVSLGILLYIKKKVQKSKTIKKTLLLELIGNTPLIYLKNLSEALNC